MSTHCSYSSILTLSTFWFNFTLTTFYEKNFTSFNTYFTFCGLAGKAQYVNIPDSNFRDKLIQMYPSCFNIMGQMDTTCNEIVNAESLNLYPAIYITSLNGLQYFKQLKHFICWNGFLITDIPQLPPTLLSIELAGPSC